MIATLLLLLALLAASAFFSSSESAFFSITQEHHTRRTPRDELVHQLLSRPDKLLSTVLFGNLVVNVCYFSISSALVIRIGGHSKGMATLLGVLFLLVLIVCGEVLPKSISINTPLRIAYLSAYPIAWLQRLLFPVVSLLISLLLWIERLLKRMFPQHPTLYSEEFDHMVQTTRERGVINSKEMQMLFGGFAFGDLKVKNILTPRAEVAACAVTCSEKQFLQLFRSHPHSKIIVYNKTIDDVQGYVFAKDLFFSRPFAVAPCVHPMAFVPELAKVRDVYHRFRVHKYQIAAVVNEYGEFEGIITYEDIVEAIIGDITNEFEQQAPPIRQIAHKRYLLVGHTLLRVWNLYFPSLSAEEVDTIGGYIAKSLEKIPIPGDSIEVKGIKLTVKGVDKNRITKVLVELP